MRSLRHALMDGYAHTPDPSLRQRLLPYVAIARPDHWGKNVFVLFGVLLAIFYRQGVFNQAAVPAILAAMVSACLVASSNYVLNELLDAPYDRVHPTKCRRPVAAGLVRKPVVIGEWLALGAIGIFGGFLVNPALGASALALWIMGCIYNVPPIRSKEQPYLDVLTESINNPLRLLLGWFALIPGVLPPLSLIIAYWMLGAFLMATKRYAEYRELDDKELATGYRRSFAYYDESRLLVSMMFYATCAALFAGIFVVRYKLELILAAPVVAVFFAYYLQVGLRRESIVQTPEKLYKERGLMLLASLSTLLFVALMFVEIPALYDLFNVDAASSEPLWRIGR